MNLQYALIAVGVVVILAIYAISKWSNKAASLKRSTYRKKPEGKNPRKEEPFLGDIRNNAGFKERDDVMQDNHAIAGSVFDSSDNPLFPDYSDKDTESNRSGVNDAPDSKAEHTNQDAYFPFGNPVSSVLKRDETHSTQEQGEGQASKSKTRYVYPYIAGFQKISQIDYWVRIYGDKDIGRESVLAQYRESRAVLTKTNKLYGQRIQDQEWVDLELESEGTRFNDLILTLQLADSSGAADELELTKFEQIVNKLTSGTGRDSYFMSSIENAFEQAQEIDKFIRQYESVFVINIKPELSNTFDGASLDRCATQLGMVRAESNVYVRNKAMNKAQVCLYRLANMTETGEFDFDNLNNLSIRGVTFFTQPAANKSPGAVFSEMVDTAKSFASRVKGIAIAPNYDDLSQEAVDKIRHSIEGVAQDMKDLGIECGSDEAKRLFE